MFWGLILKSNKKYSQTLEKPFHLSQAALDHSSSDNEPVQVMYTHEDASYLLCTLQKGKVFQCAIDLNFQEGDKLCFSTKGNGIVHLTGSLLEDEMDGFDMDEMEGLEAEESEEEEAVEDLRSKLQKKPTKAEVKAGKKKQQIPEEEEDEDSEAGDDDSDDDDDEEQVAEQESGEESDDDDDEEEDEDEDDSEDEDPAPPAKQPKLDPKVQQNGKKQKNGLENGDAKKQKQQEKGGEQGKIQKLQGGLVVQDLKTGSGAEAKPGKKIQVYYEGRLKSNNKVFDSTKAGAGFKMTLGRGEVIKGWDIGLSGMKVGGKRRLVVPPGLAYGQKGSPPVIPQNATLVFDVELKNVL